MSEPQWLSFAVSDPLSVNYVRWERADGAAGENVNIRPGSYSSYVWTDGLLTLPRLLGDFVTTRFCSAAICRLVEWRDALEARGEWRTPTLDANMGSGGVAAVFKGAEGHSRLVSRRWLEHGPWALLRREDVDLSVVLFHDPDLTDPVAALDQAYPGHQRMGISPTGGYMHVAHKASTALSGTWLEAERRLVIVVHGREVSQAEMLDACALRRDAAGTDRPVETVTYVFAEEGAARAHLHELWLRGLEVRWIRAGREVRLDENYRATPEVPPWVPAVRARWQALLDGT